MKQTKVLTHVRRCLESCDLQPDRVQTLVSRLSYGYLLAFYYSF